MIEFLFNNPFLAFILISLIVGFFNDSSKKVKEVAKPKDESTSQGSLTSSFDELLIEFEELIDSGDYSKLELEEVIERELFFLSDQEKEILKNKLKALDIPDQVSEVIEEVAETAESLREKQYEALLKRYEVKADSDVSLETKEEGKLVSLKKTNDNDLTKHLKGRITRQGLRESIVMNEILGKPRALNPYEKRF